MHAHRPNANSPGEPPINMRNERTTGAMPHLRPRELKPPVLRSVARVQPHGLVRRRRQQALTVDRPAVRDDAAPVAGDARLRQQRGPRPGGLGGRRLPLPCMDGTGVTIGQDPGRVCARTGGVVPQRIRPCTATAELTCSPSAPKHPQSMIRRDVCQTPCLPTLRAPQSPLRSRRTRTGCRSPQLPNRRHQRRAHDSCRSTHTHDTLMRVMAN